MSKDRIKSLLGITAMVAAAASIIAVSYITGQKKREYKSYDFAMGTALSADIYTEGLDEAKEKTFNQRLFQEIKKLDTKVISWRTSDSEVYNINNRKKGYNNVPVSKNLKELIELSLDIGNTTDGALDITLRPVLNVWGIENETDSEDFSIPDKSLLEEERKKCGFEKIKIENDRMLIPDDITLDFGATGKGYALDKARLFLKQENRVKGAVISVGGSIMTYGVRPDGEKFSIGIRDPEGAEGDVMGVLNVGEAFISTSGNYEKYIEKDGKRYHHIIDRNTLYPAESGLKSVTVIASNGALSDGLSTALFVLGVDRSLPVLEKYNAEAIFITTDNKVIITDGIRDEFSICADGYILDSDR